MDTALLHQMATAVGAAPTTVIYVAIGCAQGHYAPGAHNRQQYPPFLTNWSPRHAERCVILIDPALEDPPRCVADIEEDSSLSEAETRRIKIYPVREEFHWDNSAHRAFIAGLIRIVLAAPRPTYLIVQDYSGADPMDTYITFLESEYRTDARSLLDRVLFDPAYDGPGCFQDLTVPILRDGVTGAFLQPAYIPLTRLITATPTPPPSVLHKQKEVRSALIRYYAARLFRGDLSHERAVDALERMRLFAPILGYRPTADPSLLRNLISATLRDFGAVATPPRTYTDADISALLADTRGNLLNLEFHALTH